ncbi:phospholipid carrier-dependent glycosyltransferase [Sphingomonas sp. PB2P19]|uniref:phospholipid carrier-dependent glycosyltransferase n=1 Tax=Sphingomonas rhamnosi TaxID=3096156 RepID=UPI002FC6CC67
MRTRPLAPAIAIGALAQAVFAWRLTTPHSLVFDEIHYVPAARTLLTLWHPVNTEHPLLGKLLIALGIALFGDNPLGWRALSTLAGTATVLGVYAILWLMLGRVRRAVIGSLLVLVNCTVFVQARIAMLDGFMAAFVVGAVAAMLWAMRGKGPQVWRRWLLGSVLLGLAVGVKWTALPYVAYAGIAFLCLNRPNRWPGLALWRALAILGLGSGLTYLATFAPAFFYAQDPLTIRTLIPFQFEMLTRQTIVLPHHNYQSPWWSWPLMIRPVWYLYEPVDGAVRGVLMIGNPVVMWGGLVAVALCLRAAIRERSAMLYAVAGLWAGSWAMWAVIPKSVGFFYYYYLSSIWLCVVLAVALDRVGRRRPWDVAFLTLAAGLFVYFYPILSAAALPDSRAFVRWIWFSSWA